MKKRRDDRNSFRAVLSTAGTRSQEIQPGPWADRVLVLAAAGLYAPSQKGPELGGAPGATRASYNRSARRGEVISFNTGQGYMYIVCCASQYPSMSASDAEMLNAVSTDFKYSVFEFSVTALVLCQLLCRQKR